MKSFLGIFLFIIMCNSPLTAAPDSFEVFQRQFKLAETSTEKHNPLTEALSQTFQKNPVAGLILLYKADLAVLQGYDHFLETYLESLSQTLAEALNSGGRLFLVGSGSSGRIAVDLAAKWGSYFKDDPLGRRVIGLIAGGPRAIVQAKEGFEDSESAGAEALMAYAPTSKDVVILISASGSAKFNVGCGKAASQAGAKLFYFYNSKTIPPRTEALFTDFKGSRLLVDIGPQAISGSTRLQGATLAEMCLGAALTRVIDLKEDKDTLASFKGSLETANQKIFQNLENIAKIVQQGIEAFSAPDANFRNLKDTASAAYVTVLGDENSIREVLVDATETAPTFSTNPPRSKAESYKKKAEFRAYLLGDHSNAQAWECLAGRDDFSPAEAQEMAEICLSQHEPGFGSFQDRPKGPGNLVILALKSLPQGATLQAFESLQKTGGQTALVCLGTDPGAEKSAVHGVYLDIPPSDPLGILQTIALKQTLNLISNGMMLGLHKVIGNRMVDVRLANQKLVYRSIRIVKDLMGSFKLKASDYSDRQLYDLLQAANTYKNDKESKEGIYVPSPVKIVLAQLITGQSLEESVQLLYAHREDVEALTPKEFRV